MAGTISSRMTRTCALALLAAAVSLGGCTSDDAVRSVENLNNYLNLRSSLLDPSQVGRFDKASMWRMNKPVVWPILDQLDVVDEPNDRWVNATDPLPEDTVVQKQEYLIGEGDQVRVSVYELVTPGLEYFKETTVNELGDVSIQNIGTVHVDGLTPTQIEQKIGDVAVEKGLLLKAGNGSPGPQVTVTLLQSRSRIFNIRGNVGGPGTYNILNSDFRLMDAIALAHDIAGGTQAGMDYLYIIRPSKDAGVIPATLPAATGTSPASAPAADPLKAIDNLGGPKTEPSSAPATRPSASKPQPQNDPQYLRAITADAISVARLPDPTHFEFVYDKTTGAPVIVAQADLDAALGAGATTRAAAAPATLPAASAAEPATRPGFHFVSGQWVSDAPAATTAPASGEDLLNQATSRPGYAFVNGKWVVIDPAATQNGAQAAAAASGLSLPRIIRIPINQFLEGNPKYNIVIRPGDTIVVPNIEPGEFYMYGHVNRPGVYSLTGRKVTLKQALASAGGLDALAIPRRCDLIRRIGPNQEVTVQIDLQRIWDGEQPDIYLKANDLINVGTDLIAPFLSVTRNAYRISYGFGFVYDKNFYNAPAPKAQ